MTSILILYKANETLYVKCKAAFKVGYKFIKMSLKPIYFNLA